MSDAWGGSWGTSWAQSWFGVAVTGGASDSGKAGWQTIPSRRKEKPKEPVPELPDRTEEDEEALFIVAALYYSGAWE